MKKIKSTKIKWMTELKHYCDHPEDYLKLYFDILDKPYYFCQKCGTDISIEEKDNKYQDRDQKSLWE